MVTIDPLQEYRVSIPFFGVADRDKWNEAKRAGAVAFWKQLKTDDQRRRIYLEEFEPDKFSAELSGRFLLRTDGTNSQWYEAINRLVAAKDEEDRRRAELVKETERKTKLGSIWAMKNEELAEFLRKYPDCPNAIAEALARILTK